MVAVEALRPPPLIPVADGRAERVFVGVGLQVLVVAVVRLVGDLALGVLPAAVSPKSAEAERAIEAKRQREDVPNVIRMNSGGGVATEGSAIAAALQAHPGGCDVLVEGIAASAASD